LLEAGADTQARIKDGRTALQLASMYNRQDVVRILQEYDGRPAED
jgi:ankyrin repeat protein